MVTFLTTGNFVGDEMLYVFLAAQLVITGQAQKWLGTTGFRDYGFRFQAGTLSPNHEWTIYCTACPSYIRYYKREFTLEDDEWTIVEGLRDADAIRGVKLGETNFKRYIATMILPSTAIILSARSIVTHSGGIGNGSNDYHTLRGYSDVGMTTQTVFLGGGFFTEADHQIQCAHYQGDPRAIAFQIAGQVEQTNYPNTEALRHSIELWLSPNAKIGRLIPDVGNPCI
jgi:hypothetical protein